MTLRSQNNAIILISDITKGMKSIGSKALLELDNKTTIIEYQIQYLKKFYYPINIYLCTGFDHDKIVKITNKYKNIFYCYNENYENDNQASSLMECIQKFGITDNVMVLTNGLIPIHKININKKESSIEITDKNTKIPFEVGCLSSSILNYLFYGLPFKWTEFLFLNKEGIEKIIEISKTKQYKKMFLFEMINLLLDHGLNIKLNHIIKNLPIKVNNIKDIKIAKKYYEKNLHNTIK